MKYIGEFQKKTMILLELLTNDTEDHPITVDYPPKAIIEYQNQNGLQEVDSVTLKTMEDLSTHVFDYEIPDHWEYGKYVITYIVSVNGVEHKIQENFRVIEEHDYEIKEIEESYDDSENYVLPYTFQQPAKVEVIDNIIIITPENQPLYNHTYQVILSKNIASVNQRKLNKTQIFAFTSEYKPLFCTPLEVRAVLKQLFGYFSLEEIYSAIRDASQKALTLLRQIPDPNNNRYREMRATNSAVFPSQQYASYEASLKLLSSLLVRLLNGEDIGIQEGIHGKGSISLGDFSVNLGNSSSDEPNSEETVIEKIQFLMEEIEKEMKFWRDAMMNRNARGYAKPASAAYRSDVGSITGRDFE